MSEWKSFETAPKDGTLILVYWSGSRCFGLLAYEDLLEDGNIGWYDQFSGEKYHSFTHWQQLPPEPPK